MKWEYLIRCFFMVAVMSPVVSAGQGIDRKLINVGNISPEAASFMKFGNIPVNSNTGVPGIDIPLFQIEAAGLKLPISLIYHAGGVRVDEKASSVGLSWALSAGNIITRQLAEYPDEYGTLGYLSTPDPAVVNAQKSNYFSYLYQVIDGLIDATPDVFSYSVNGKSGKFVFKKDGSFLQIPVTDNRIERYYSSDGRMLFNIITPDGYINVFEKTEQYSFGSVSNQQLTPDHINTWHVTKIISPERSDTIFFNYENNCGMYSYETNRTFSRTVGTQPVYVETGGSQGYIQIEEINSWSQTTQVNRTTPAYLNSISWRGGKVDFTYTCDRQDAGNGEKRLREVNVYARQSDIFNKVKHIKLFQSYFFNASAGTSTDERNHRLRLDSVIFYPTTGTGQKAKYSISYDSTSLSPRESYAQDLFGFDNGKLTNTDLLAKQIAPRGIMASGAFNPNYVEIGTADRSVNEAKMKAAIIRSITYPTGGRTEFDFEAHQFNTGMGKAIPGSTSCYAYGGMQSTCSTTFTAGSNWENARYNVFLSKYNYPGVTGIPVVTIFNNTTGQQIAQIANMNPYVDLLYRLQALELIPGNTYTLSVNIHTTTALEVSGGITVEWENRTTMPDIQKGGGLRIKSIANYNGNGDLLTKDEYTYGQNEDGLGILLTPFTYYSDNKKSTTYRLFYRPIISLSCLTAYGYLSHTYTSGSLNPLSNFSGSPVLYEYVTRYSIDRNMQAGNGKTVSEFNVYQDNQNVPAPDVYNKGIQLQPSSWKNGFLRAMTHYRSTGTGTYTPLAKQEYHYTSSRPASSAALKVTSVYTDTKDQCDSRLASFPYDVFTTVYPIQTGVFLLTSTVNTSYDSAGGILVDTKEMLYQNTNDLLLTAVNSAGSKAESIHQVFKYPGHFASPGNVYQKMVDKNMIEPLIEEVISVNNVQKSLTRRPHMDVNGDAKLLLPSSIEVQKGTYAPETAITFNRWDAFGNILEQQKSDDVKEVYIWGYQSQYPVAKIMGSNYDTVTAVVPPPLVHAATNIAYNDANVRSLLNILRTDPRTKKAMIHTYTYAPLVGMTSETAPNGRTTFYFYDGMGRLDHVKDHEGNVVRKFCYNYAGQPVDCSVNVNPSWSSTGNLRCATSGGANTGYQEREEKDVNPYSTTFNQLRWVSNGYNSTACPPPVQSCSISVNYGFSPVASNITNNGSSASFYLVVYTGNYLWPGNSYDVATIDGGCRPTTTQTLYTSSGGNNWVVTIHPSGLVNWYLQSGPGVSPGNTVGIGTLTYTY
jgi:hypothetical protein